MVVVVDYMTLMELTGAQLVNQCIHMSVCMVVVVDYMTLMELTGPQLVNVTRDALLLRMCMRSIYKC